MDGKVVVYTAYTTDYDKVVSPIPIPGVKYVAHCDKLVNTPPWEFRKLASFPNHRQPERIATREAKIRCHFFHVGITIYVDANMTVDLQEVIKSTQAPGLYAIPHYARRCAYDEANVVIEKRLDNSEIVQAQMARYRKHGYPLKNGLHQGGLVVRHNTAKIAAFTDMWWQQVLDGSTRDQLSLNYAAWRVGLPVFDLDVKYKTHKHKKSRKRTGDGAAKDIS